ncbi:hypothetical protein GLAREA_05266 [Glarea lozoyensis ATCC 20868]|uniref:Secreted protein n=1 Tax=Glarea lozoyensis (strain ATCC 20868 / MF5171) TaxID=1116229 RepID=S3EC95_GLAL2|nr:uncharacterized protein GLAREA_05266 [Glarea lozoyensis ATCC 20868]EPE35928.1 hypothetical protein GLAREA_05266 [Glarea lozoyensis ATCC 20868]
MLLTISAVSFLSFTSVIVALMDHHINDIRFPDTINEADYQVKPGSNRIPLDGELPANIAKIQSNSDTDGFSAARQKREVPQEKAQELPPELPLTTGGTFSAVERCESFDKDLKYAYGSCALQAGIIAKYRGGPGEDPEIIIDPKKCVKAACYNQAAAQVCNNNDKHLKILAADVGNEVKDLVAHGTKYEKKTHQACGRVTNSNGWTITIKNDKDGIGACDDGKYHDCEKSSFVGDAKQIAA